MKYDFFVTQPIEIRDGIPVFSKHDSYIENYEHIARDHLQSQAETKENPFIPEELWVILEDSTRTLIQKHVAAGGKILDVGVGLGRVLGPLNQFERYGIDISLDYLKIARENGINVAFSKIEDMPYTHDYFDAVVVTDVLEHVFDLNECCRKIIHVLKPGGVLIVRVPFKEDLDVYLNDGQPYEFVHLRNFDEASLRLLFVKIFKLSFIESAPVAPFLQGTPRFKVRLLPEEILQKIKNIAQKRLPLHGLLATTTMSSENFQTYLYSLRDQYPEDYQLVVEHLVYGIEINAIFKKPLLQDHAETSDVLIRASQSMDAKIDVEQNISQKNVSFWNELCGSHMAKDLNITDASLASLKKFDSWYFDFYPYLFDHIPFDTLQGKDVLEIGLGYGTVAQRLAESGCNYTGLDIAAGPVQMVNHRLNQTNLPGKAVQGSVLEPPFESASFDTIMVIGCLHHTGNLQLAIQQCYKMLKPGGNLIFMVYAAYSYRRWRMAFRVTAGYWLRELKGYRGVVGISQDKDRAAYDTGSNGVGAPHTDWISGKSLQTLCADFSAFKCQLENIDQESPFKSTPRTKLLKTCWPRLIGLDLYATATK